MLVNVTLNFQRFITLPPGSHLLEPGREFIVIDGVIEPVTDDNRDRVRNNTFWTGISSGFV